MYVASDPRARLQKTETHKKDASRPLAAATYARFYEVDPDQVSDHARTWYMRGENFIVSYSKTTEGAVFERANQPDEYMVILPDPETRVEVEWEGSTTVCNGHSVIFIPAGASRISVKAGGQVIQFFTKRSEDLARLCSNYQPDHNVAPFEPWPDPVDGYRVRCYPMNIPQQEGRFGRILRCSTFMVNYIYPRSGPRPRNTMSPHSHADFQQCSLAIEGTYVHHLRWPWSNDADEWREDEHEVCHSPSVTVMPAGVTHTSEASGAGSNILIDVFCPPRVDFSRQPGWVLNADEYPEPEA